MKSILLELDLLPYYGLSLEIVKFFMVQKETVLSWNQVIDLLNMGDAKQKLYKMRLIWDQDFVFFFFFCL